MPGHGLATSHRCTEDGPDMPAIDGVSLRPRPPASATRAHRRAPGHARPGTAVAGVLTRSSAPRPRSTGAAEPQVGRAPGGQFRNANAFTGKTGKATCQFTAARRPGVGCKPADVFLASTGVIGEPLNAKVFDGVMEGLVAAAQPEALIDAAKAIMTTDTFPKVATATAKLGKATVTINGFAKGAGMIAPDMATMLSYVFTDAPISQRALQALLSEGVADTFNAVTIDGDTSHRTRSWRSRPARRGAWRAQDRQGQQSAAQGLQGVPDGAGGSGEQVARRLRRPRWSRSRSGAVSRPGAQDRDVDRELALVKTRRRRGRQLGLRRHGASARLASPADATSFDLVRRHPRRPQGLRL